MVSHEKQCILVDLKFHFCPVRSTPCLYFLYLENRCVKITLMICWVCNSLLSQWAGTSRITLDPNKEAFGNNATFRLTSALNPSSCYLGFLHGWEEVRHKTVGRGHRQVE